MENPRRRFVLQSLLQSAALLAGAPLIQASPMSHLVLLGDSIFDNGRYTDGKPDVIAQLRRQLAAGWKASLLAVDGATTEGIAAQLARLPGDATHLVMSIGGNNALMQQQLLDTPVRSSADAFTLLARAAQQFESAYRRAVAACLAQRLPLAVCTIYNGNFPDPEYRQRVAVALAAFNDVILRVGVEQRLTVIELRHVCTIPADYANTIEPSSEGARKIAHAIIRATSGTAAPGARVIGA
jgi:hypothetical protein